VLGAAINTRNGGCDKTATTQVL